MKKKILFVMYVFGLSMGFVSANVSGTPESVKWLYDKGLTKYDTLDAYSPETYLTREQAAKFFAEFATVVANKKEDPMLACDFSDIQQADPTLKDYIIKSCKLGIFKGTKGKFMPKNRLTKAETAAVLMRILVGQLNESNKDERYAPYLAQDIALNFGQESMGLNPDFARTSYSRGEVAILLYMAGAVINIDTADWLVYKDKDLDATFKYPEGFEVRKEPLGNNCFQYAIEKYTVGIYLYSKDGCGLSKILPNVALIDGKPFLFGEVGGEYSHGFGSVYPTYFQNDLGFKLIYGFKTRFFYPTIGNVVEYSALSIDIKLGSNFSSLVGSDGKINSNTTKYQQEYKVYEQALDDLKYIYAILLSFDVEYE